LVKEKKGMRGQKGVNTCSNPRMKKAGELGLTTVLRKRKKE